MNLYYQKIEPNICVALYAEKHHYPAWGNPVNNFFEKSFGSKLIGLVFLRDAVHLLH